MQIDQDTVALVTGASGGIGQAIARALRRAGARVIVTGRRAGALDQLTGEIDARAIVADLATRDGVSRLLDEVGQVDVLVANAALPASGALFDFSVDEIDRAIDVNLRAPAVMARVLGDRMAARGRGHIVFISSIAGKIVSPGTALYSATKFGLRGLSLGLRDDLHDAGVGVTTIFPGFIRDAGMFADTKVDLPAGLGTRSPEDVADAVLRALRDNPAEIDVAAAEQRLGVLVGSLSPSLLTRLQRRFGGSAIARAVSDAQRHKR